MAFDPINAKVLVLGKLWEVLIEEQQTFQLCMCDLILNQFVVEQVQIIGNCMCCVLFTT